MTLENTLPQPSLFARINELLAAKLTGTIKATDEAAAEVAVEIEAQAPQTVGARIKAVFLKARAAFTKRFARTSAFIATMYSFAALQVISTIEIAKIKSKTGARKVLAYIYLGAMLSLFTITTVGFIVWYGLACAYYAAKSFFVELYNKALVKRNATVQDPGSAAEAETSETSATSTGLQREGADVQPAIVPPGASPASKDITAPTVPSVNTENLSGNN